MIESLTVLGSGTILPARNHGCSGYLLCGDSSPVLIDCGPGTLCRLADVGVSPDSIEVILISHFHLDHVSDLAAFLNSRWLLQPDARHRMEIVGPPGLRAHMAWLGERMDSWFEDYRFDLVEMKDRRHCSGSICIDALPTGHTADSISYRLTDETGRTLFYSGDTDYNEILVNLARDADLAIFECSMSEKEKIRGHLTPRLAATLAHMAGVRHLVLTHFYREILGIDIRAEAKKYYDGPISLAVDLESYSIGPLGAEKQGG